MLIITAETAVRKMKLTSKQSRLAEENYNLIYAYLAKYNLSEEYYGDAAIGLCKAAQTYDENYGTEFSTYAYMCMKHACMNAKRKENTTIPCESMNVSFIESGEEVLYCVPDKTDLYEPSLAMLDLKLFMRGLKQSDREVIEYKLQDYNATEIARFKGTSRQRIWQIVKRLREQYRRYIYD